MGEPRIRCALLSATPWDFAAAIALAAEGIEFVTLPPSLLGLPDAPNPFALPEDDRPSAVLLSTSWYGWVERHAPDRLPAAMRKLEQVGVVVALDGVDAFALGLPPRVVEQVAAVIKPQGLYRDRELYNYEIGPKHPGAIWTEKVRPQAEAYSNNDLAKLRLSVPCFMADLPALRKLAREREARVAATVERGPSRVQRSARNVMEHAMWPLLSVTSMGRRPYEVQCVVSLTHVQRIEVMRLLDGFSGDRGLIPRWPDGPPGPDEDELLAAAQPYLHPITPRMSHLREMRRHRVVVAPTGYGELTYRHAEALRAGCALVCQDLSHAETMYSFRDGYNAVFCRPDLSDLTAVARALLDDEARRRRVAQTGRKTFAEWARDWRKHIYVGIEQPIREAI